MDALLHDLRYALRSLTRSKGVPLAILLTLALGIGANTAIFSVANALLVRSLPYPDPDRLYVLWNQNTREGIDEDITSYPNFLDWQSGSRTFESMAAYANRLSTIGGNGDPEEVAGVAVTADFFRLLGLSPVLGRVPAAEEYEPGGEAVVVLSHELWSRRYGRDRTVVGRTIQLSDHPTQVIGVMPASFSYPRASEYWVPLVPDDGLRNARGALWLNVLGRLRAGVEREAAQREMAGVASRLEAEYPQNQGLSIKLESLRDSEVGDIRPVVLVLLGAVGLVLLIACANVANLLLARMTGRYREMAVRAAMGAPRGRLVRQILTESVVVALAGAVLGVALAASIVDLLPAVAPADLPTIGRIEIDLTVLGFTALLAVLTGLAFGLAPALSAARQDPGATLQRGGRWGTDGGRLRPLLVTAEVAIALVLLVGAGLMLRSFAELGRVDVGLERERVLSARLFVTPARYGEPADVRRFYDDLLTRLEARPEVESAGAASTVLLSRLPNMAPINVEGRADYAEAIANASVTIDVLTTDALGTLGIPITRGRGFDTRDEPDATQTVIVNESFVRRYFGADDPLGQRVTFDTPSDSALWFTIVGTAADARRSGIAEQPRPELYRPHTQFPQRRMRMVVRGSEGVTAGALEPVVAEVLRTVDPTQPMADVASLEKQLAGTLADRRFLMILLGLFAACALLLAAVGLYGVMSYLVGRRSRELGLRIALGAAPRGVRALVVVDAAKKVVPGIVVGLVASLLVGRLIRAQLYGVSALDLRTLLTVPVFLALVAFVASYVPAWRASRIEPATALREE